jgi:hypothetical protein
MEPEVTQLEEIKADVYETWAVINRAFEKIITALGKLENRGVLSSDYVTNQETITNELWAKINCHILSAINSRELDDRNHYGKMRTALGKRSNKTK